jgi:hypothetical protein
MAVGISAEASRKAIGVPRRTIAGTAPLRVTAVDPRLGLRRIAARLRLRHRAVRAIPRRDPTRHPAVAIPRRAPSRHPAGAIPRRAPSRPHAPLAEVRASLVDTPVPLDTPVPVATQGPPAGIPVEEAADTGGSLIGSAKLRKLLEQVSGDAWATRINAGSWSSRRSFGSQPVHDATCRRPPIRIVQREGSTHGTRRSQYNGATSTITHRNSGAFKSGEVAEWSKAAVC